MGDLLVPLLVDKEATVALLVDKEATVALALLAVKEAIVALQVDKEVQDQIHLAEQADAEPELLNNRTRERTEAAEATHSGDSSLEDQTLLLQPLSGPEGQPVPTILHTRVDQPRISGGIRYF